MLQAIPRYVGSLGTASDGFFSLAPTGIFQTSTPSLVEVIWPTSGVFRNLYTVLSDDPGTGDVRVFKLRIAGTDSALTTTHAATDVTSKNTADVVAITAGQRVVMILDTTGTADAANLHYTIEFDSDTAYASAYAANISTTTSGFVDIFTGRTNASADICRRYIPCDGTISKLVGTNMSSSVGPSVSLTFYIYKTV